MYWIRTCKYMHAYLCCGNGQINAFARGTESGCSVNLANPASEWFQSWNLFDLLLHQFLGSQFLVFVLWIFELTIHFVVSKVSFDDFNGWWNICYCSVIYWIQVENLETNVGINKKSVPIWIFRMLFVLRVLKVQIWCSSDRLFSSKVSMEDSNKCRDIDSSVLSFPEFTVEIGWGWWSCQSQAARREKARSRRVLAGLSMYLTMLFSFCDFVWGSDLFERLITIFCAGASVWSFSQACDPE